MERSTNSRKRSRNDDRVTSSQNDSSNTENSNNRRASLRRKQDKESTNKETKETSTSTSNSKIPESSSSSSKTTQNTKNKKKSKKDTPSDDHSPSDGKKEVESGEKTPEKQETNEVQCGICLESVIIQGILNNCTHSFCVTCIKEWAKTSNTCPFCKARFTQISEADLNAPKKKTKKTRVKYTEQRGTEDEYAALPASYFLFMNDHEEYDSEMDEDYEDLLGEDDLMEGFPPEYEFGDYFGFGSFSDSDLSSEDDFFGETMSLFSEPIDLTNLSSDDDDDDEDEEEEVIHEIRRELYHSSSSESSDSERTPAMHFQPIVTVLPTPSGGRGRGISNRGNIPRGGGNRGRGGNVRSVTNSNSNRGSLRGGNRGRGGSPNANQGPNSRGSSQRGRRTTNRGH